MYPVKSTKKSKSRINYIFAVLVILVLLCTCYLIYRAFVATPYHHDNETLKDFNVMLPNKVVTKGRNTSDLTVLGEGCSASNVNMDYLTNDGGHCVHSCTTGLPLRKRNISVSANFTFPRSVKLTENDEHRKEAFVKIYKKGGWGNFSTGSTRHVSGPGSLKKKTKNIQNTLAAIVDRIKVAHNKQVVTLLDLPCGDFTWMESFLAGRKDIVYTGVDIVPDLIRELHDKHSNKTVSFRQSDVSVEAIQGEYDLVLVRHLTQHLTDYDTLRALDHISNSKSLYVLITHYPSWLNSDLKYGMDFRFRAQNLEIPPYSLSAPLCQDSDGDTDVAALWRLPLKQVHGCKKPPVNVYHNDKYGRRVYVCL